MLRPVRLAKSVSVASPPASAMVSNRNSARSTDWMLWRSPLAARWARVLAPGPGRMVAFIILFSLAAGKSGGECDSRNFQYKERHFHNAKSRKSVFCLFSNGLAAKGLEPVPALSQEHRTA